MPEEQAVSPFFKNRRCMQEKYLKDINETLSEAEIVKVPMYNSEIKGIDMLKEICEKVF